MPDEALPPVPEAFEEDLRRAREGDAAALGRLLEYRRSRLAAQAQRQLGERLLARVDASDVVQQTFLEAYRCFDQFLGGNDVALAAWLRGILDHNIAEQVRHHVGLQKRDVRRERSIDEGPSGPTVEPDAGYSTPSQRAMRTEDEERLGRALETLPPDQREAVRMRHLEGKSLSDIAEHLDRSLAATAGLVKRGIQALRRNLKEMDGSAQ